MLTDSRQYATLYAESQRPGNAVVLNRYRYMQNWRMAGIPVSVLWNGGSRRLQRRGDKLTMKKTAAVLLTSFLFLGLCVGASAEETEKEEIVSVLDESVQTESQTEGDQECEWNVLVYLCGTDLESKEGLATQNLLAVASTIPNGSVNLLVQTGGTKQWDPAEKMGMGIANDRLQRWYYGTDGFELVDEAEDASMSDARTLSDFIRWGRENYSAKKNLLVLWDHGGGSSTGLILDENYDDSIMPVYELENALREGGTHFDLILTDTCLMASLEMCQALVPYADYLAASEEVMAGDGTDYNRWVQYLYDRPECDAVQLGKRICDYTQEYYTETDQAETAGSFTMSLIDLSRIDAVAEAFNAFIHDVADLVQDPDAFYDYAQATYYAENYMLNTMYDLFDLSRRAESGGISGKVTHAVQDAVEDAVVYNLRSKNHIFSHGLSVYYSLNDDDRSLDHFARTCRNPEHLAFLDCINNRWNAPDWVYQKVARRPEMKRSSYSIVTDVECSEDGSGAWLKFRSGYESAVFLSYDLYYRDAEYGVMYTLGESGNLIQEEDEETGTYRFAPGFDGTWPTMNKRPMCMSIADETDSYILYNIPVGIFDDRMQLRVLVNYDTSDQEEDSDAQEETESDAPEETSAVHDETDGSPYTLLGLWDGYDAHTGLPGRNSIPLSQIDGVSVTLYNVVYSSLLDKISDYIDCEQTQITKDTVIDREKLPEGEYMMRFVVRDVFNTAHYSDYVTLYWDGETVSGYQIE